MSDKELVDSVLSCSNSKKKLYIVSDEVIELDIIERTQGHIIDVIKPAPDPRILSARAKDLDLGVFVTYGSRA